MKKTIIAISAFIIGLIPAFFIVFNSVFTDSNGSFNERAVTFLLVIVVYVILGFIFTFMEKSKSRLPWVTLSLPAVLILVCIPLKRHLL